MLDYQINNRDLLIIHHNHNLAINQQLTLTHLLDDDFLSSNGCDSTSSMREIKSLSLSSLTHAPTPNRCHLSSFINYWLHYCQLYHHYLFLMSSEVNIATTSFTIVVMSIDSPFPSLSHPSPHMIGLLWNLTLVTTASLSFCLQRLSLSLLASRLLVR